MIVRGAYQQAMDFIGYQIEKTFPTFPKTWLSDRSSVSYAKEGAYPFIEIKVPTRNDFVMKPFAGGQQLNSIKGLGYISFQFEISIIGQTNSNSVIWIEADNNLTTFLLNLPHDKYTDYLGFDENFVTIDGYGYEEVERDEDNFQLTKYTAVISVNQYLGKRKDYDLVEVELKEFSYKTEENDGKQAE